MAPHLPIIKGEVGKQGTRKSVLTCGSLGCTSLVRSALTLRPEEGWDRGAPWLPITAIHTKKTRAIFPEPAMQLQDGTKTDLGPVPAGGSLLLSVPLPCGHNCTCSQNSA